MEKWIFLSENSVVVVVAAAVINRPHRPTARNYDFMEANSGACLTHETNFVHRMYVRSYVSGKYDQLVMR